MPPQNLSQHSNPLVNLLSTIVQSNPWTRLRRPWLRDQMIDLWISSLGYDRHSCFSSWIYVLIPFICCALVQLFQLGILIFHAFKHYLNKIIQIMSTINTFWRLSSRYRDVWLRIITMLAGLCDKSSTLLACS